MLHGAAFAFPVKQLNYNTKKKNICQLFFRTFFKKNKKFSKKFFSRYFFLILLEKPCANEKNLKQNALHSIVIPL